MTTIAFEDVHRAYRRGVDVLHGVSFSVAPGEVVGLLGRNGAGKTTLLSIAMGMLEAQSGSARVFGLDPREHPVAVKQRVGYVSEDQTLPGFMTVEAVVGLHRRLFEGWDEGLAGDLLRRFDLPPGRRISALSKGQARQVALLCAISHRPELLLLDEPAGGLDPAARREFLETSIQFLADQGSTILFSSHYMTDVERLARRVVMLHDGRVLIDSELDHLRENHCLALLPHGPALSAESIRELPHCLGVRDRSEALHAAFSLAPEECRRLLDGRLSVAGIRCQSVPLEEMFIELAGGQQ